MRNLGLFDYDELGNRVRKRYLLKQAEGSYNVEKDLQYIYDVRGNMLAVYDQQFLKEQNIFGTSRLGTYKTTQKTKGERQVGDAEEAGKVIFGNRTYEMTNHLGNVMATVSDRVNKENGAFDAVVISAQDYYPYGLMMEGRRYLNGENSYRYGFQGQEEDGETSLVNYKYRMHNPRIGRFFSVDPLAPKYPHNSPYAFSENDVIASVELEGLEKAPAQNRTYDQGIRDGRKEVLQNYQKDKESTKWYTNLFGLTDLYNSTVRRVDAVTDYAKYPPQDEYEGARMDTKVKYTTFMNEVDGVLSKSEVFTEGFALAMSWFGSATIKGALKPAVKVISKEVVENSAARGVTNVIPEGKLANHLFKGANKLADTPANRALIQKISNGKSLGVDQYGKSWFAKTLDNGTQIYTYTRNGVVKGAGINQTPVDIIARYGLK